MAEIVRMPRLSDTMEEGTIAKWYKKIGDVVEEGDLLAEIETDKATQEFEAFQNGTVLYIGVEEGQPLEVDKIIAILGEKGEDISALIAEDSSTDEEVTENTTTSAESGSAQVEIPANVEIINMPRLSDTMEEGTVAKWYKKVGDQVNEGDILAEIETDKATQEFEAFQTGTLLYIGTQEGETAQVDTILAILGDEGTNVDAIIKASQNPVSTPDQSEKKIEKPSAVEVENTVSSGSSSDTSGIKASPLARKMATDKGIDLSTVKGTGDNGRIVKVDIENYTPSANTPSAAASGAVSVPQVQFISGEETSLPNSGMRKTIAKRLSESKFTAPHYYLAMEIDMENAIASRKQLNAFAAPQKISFNDMVVKVAAMALQKHPKVNTTWTEKNTIVHGDINIGVAVAVEDGLVVPVVKHTNQKTLSQINTEVKDLAVRARDKKIQANEMEGSTFTISNLGMFGIDYFTSIINQPNSAILSVGAIVEKPVVKDGQIVVGNRMKITLACDHRTIDGATGAAFLQTFKQMLENPITILV